MDQQSLADFGVAPDEDAAQSARAKLVRESPLHQLAPPSLHPSSPPPADPSPIDIDWRLVFLVLPRPVALALIRFQQLPPQSLFLQVQNGFVAVVSLVPNHFPDLRSQPDRLPLPRTPSEVFSLIVWESPNSSSAITATTASVSRSSASSALRSSRVRPSLSFMIFAFGSCGFPYSRLLVALLVFPIKPNQFLPGRSLDPRGFRQSLHKRP